MTKWFKCTKLDPTNATNFTQNAVYKWEDGTLYGNISTFTKRCVFPNWVDWNFYSEFEEIAGCDISAIASNLAHTKILFDNTDENDCYAIERNNLSHYSVVCKPHGKLAITVDGYYLFDNTLGKMVAGPLIKGQDNPQIGDVVSYNEHETNVSATDPDSLYNVPHQGTDLKFGHVLVERYWDNRGHHSNGVPYYGAIEADKRYWWTEDFTMIKPNPLREVLKRMVEELSDEDYESDEEDSSYASISATSFEVRGGAGSPVIMKIDPKCGITINEMFTTIDDSLDVNNNTDLTPIKNEPLSFKITDEGIINTLQAALHSNVDKVINPP